MEKRALMACSSEDSGFASISDIMYKSTPLVESPHKNRKRKLGQMRQPCFDRYTPNLISSTFNESSSELTKSLEHCNISSFSPNFYVERSGSKKPCSLPETPTEDTSFYTLHSNALQKTPSKPCESLQKLGSPERNKILYGEIRSNSVTKLHSPKVEVSFKRTPAVKKRLFTLRNKIDPLLFLRENGCLMVIRELLDYLSDADLYRCKVVSKVWAKVVYEDSKASKRLKDYVEKRRVNKENFLNQNQRSSTICNSPMKSPADAFYKIGKTLKDGQRLDKCPQCMHVTIIDNNIGQCQNDNCGYIYCLSCNSFSTTGPQNFSDSCMSSSLVYEKPILNPLFTDSPVKSSSDLPSFLLNTPCKHDSSGYSTDSGVSPIVKSAPEKRRRSVLSVYNRELPKCALSNSRRNSLIPVVPMNAKHDEIIEPSSPPKIKNIACSAASKRNLKRLLRR